MQSVWQSVWEVAAPLSAPAANLILPGSRIFVLYLAGAFLIAFLVYVARRTERTPAGNPSAKHRFLSFCFSKRIYAHKSAIVDYRYYVVNSLLWAFGLMPMLVGIPMAADAVAGGLEELAGPVYGVTAPASEGALGLAAESLAISPLVQLCYTLAVLIAFDGGVFVAHTLQHRVPALWEFHKVHHSAQVLTPITLYRMHPVDDIVSGACVALTVGTVAGGFSWWHGAPVVEFLIAGLNPGLFAFYLLGYNLRHSHIWLAYPRWLSWLLISPAQHQIHHSSSPEHFNRNLGLIFSFWDRMAATLHVPATRETFALGLGDGQDEQYDSVAALYLLPFRKAARLVLAPVFGAKLFAQRPGDDA